MRGRAQTLLGHKKRVWGEGQPDARSRLRHPSRASKLARFCFSLVWMGDLVNLEAGSPPGQLEPPANPNGATGVLP